MGFLGSLFKRKVCVLFFLHLAVSNLDVMAQALEIILDHGCKAHNLGTMQEFSERTIGP